MPYIDFIVRLKLSRKPSAETRQELCDRLDSAMSRVVMDADTGDTVKSAIAVVVNPPPAISQFHPNKS